MISTRERADVHDGRTVGIDVIDARDRLRGLEVALLD
jgi:hypothetical protein